MGKYRESPVGLECNVKAEETRNKIWMQVVYGEMDPRKHPHLPCPPGWAKGNGGLVEGETPTAPTPLRPLHLQKQWAWCPGGDWGIVDREGVRHLRKTWRERVIGKHEEN